jgi:hypothetical protein
MNPREAILPALLLAMTAALLIGGFAVGYSWTAIVFPLASGGAVCVLCTIELIAIRERRSATVPAMTAEDETAPLSPASIAWMFALALFLFGLGFVAGPAAYLLVCLRANGFSWPLSTCIAVASLAVTWGLFIKIMGILLPIVPLWMT